MGSTPILNELRTWQPTGTAVQEVQRQQLGYSEKRGQLLDNVIAHDSCIPIPSSESRGSRPRPLSDCVYIHTYSHTARNGGAESWLHGIPTEQHSALYEG